MTTSLGKTIPGTLHIFNYGARAFDLTFAPDGHEQEHEPYRVARMERLLKLAQSLGIAFSGEEAELLQSGKHIKKVCELQEPHCRMLFG